VNRQARREGRGDARAERPGGRLVGKMEVERG
jgi:hypothetical protein